MKTTNLISIRTVLFLMIGVFIIPLNSCTKGNKDNNTIKDFDGNIYTAVTIGTQVWMIENLKVTHYRNGDPIPLVSINSSWVSLTTGAYSDYNNEVNNSSTYGRLYNWYTVDDPRKLCPTGWHVPSFVEWAELTDFLGGNSIASEKMKEAMYTHWAAPNTGTNESGFTALGAGYRNLAGAFSGLLSVTHWWSSTEDYIDYAWGLQTKESGVLYFNWDKILGFSVRCLKD